MEVRLAYRPHDIHQNWGEKSEILVILEIKLQDESIE